jgi:cellobiose dehydrogenase (acceptor)
MVGKLLLVAWPAGETAQGSVRLATMKASPGEYAGASMVPIPKGTYSKADSWQYTFLCKGCMNGTVSFDTAAQSASFAWAASTSKVAQPTNKATALTYHMAGSGQYTAAISAARSDKFDSWAAMAAPAAAI